MIPGFVDSWKTLPQEIYDHIIIFTDFVTAVKLKNRYAISRLYVKKIHTLKWSAENGYLEVLQWLHSNIKNPDVDNYNVAFHCAAANGHLHVVKWIHLHVKDIKCSSAMSHAAYKGHLNVVKW